MPHKNVKTVLFDIAYIIATQLDQYWYIIVTVWSSYQNVKRTVTSDHTVKIMQQSSSSWVAVILAISNKTVLRFCVAYLMHCTRHRLWLCVTETMQSSWIFQRFQRAHKSPIQYFKWTRLHIGMFLIKDFKCY